MQNSVLIQEQNSQSHSSNSSVIADELFERV